METNLISLARDSLSTTIVSDILDSMGRSRQAMAAGIRPLDDSLPLFGRARTARVEEGVSDDEKGNPYRLGIQLVDSLSPDDVAVLACEESDRLCPWGELVTNAAIGRAAAGCVTNGYVRDVRLIKEARFPVFCGGIAPLDLMGRGRFAAIDTPVQCAGVAVAPGDFILGDADGVIVIPEDHLQRVIEQVAQRSQGEDAVRQALRSGSTLKEVFEKYGTV